MSEQSGRNESSERPGSERPDSDRSVSDRSVSDRSASARQRQSTPASDMLSDLQRWLLRSTARSMGRELGGQVRRTFGGSRQQMSTADVWDTATTEIPPEVGESPECQWCPICRAARRMREAGPGLGGQLSGAGDAVATVVQDAISAVDSILSKAGGGDQRAPASSRPAPSARTGSPPAGTGRGRANSKPGAQGSGNSSRHGGERGAGSSRKDGREDSHAAPAADHGPGGWKPGDRLATEHAGDPDPWAGATDADDGVGDIRQPGTDASASPPGPDEAQLDGQGHGPDDRR